MKRKSSIKDISKYILIISLTVIGLFIITYLGASNHSNNKHLAIYTSNFEENEFVKIHDNYDGKGEKSFSEVIRDKSYVDKYKSFYNDLISSNKFTYIELNAQPLEAFSKEPYTGDLTFIYGYEDGVAPEVVNQKTKLNGNDTYFSPIKAIQIGDIAVKYLKLQDKLSSGQLFEDEDYNFNKNNEINVILGYEYSKAYKIGDSFEITYITVPIKCKVIGFLEKNTLLPYNSKMLTLDTYIIMPFFNIIDYNDVNGDFERFYIIHYSLKSSGFIPYKSTEEGIEIRNEIQLLGKENGLSYTTDYIKGALLTDL